MNYAKGYVSAAENYIMLILANETDSVQLWFNTNGEDYLPVGVYEVDIDFNYTPGTWDPEESGWWSTTNSGTLTNGTIYVEKSGENYTIYTNCIDENGNPINYNYKGVIGIEQSGFPNSILFRNLNRRQESYIYRINVMVVR